MLSCSRAVHRYPSPSITVHHHAVHHRQFAIAPSLSVHCHCDRCPSPSRLCCPSPYIAIKEPLRHPLPSRSRRAVHCHRAAPSITVKEPSIAVDPSSVFKSSPLLRPSLSITVESPSCRPSLSHRAVHHCLVTIAPSFTVHRCCNHSPSALHSHHPLPSIATNKPSRLPSPSSCHRAVHHSPSLYIAVHHCCDRSPSPSPSQSRCPLLYCRQGATAPSIAIKEPSRRPLTSRCTIH